MNNKYIVNPIKLDIAFPFPYKYVEYKLKKKTDKTFEEVLKQVELEKRGKILYLGKTR